MSDAIILYENGKAIGGEGHPTDADDITFDNTGTDLVSENVEDAIVEVNAKTQHGLYEIWKNTSTSSFAGQTLSVTTDKEYDAFQYELVDDSGNTRAFGMSEVGKLAVMPYVSLDQQGVIYQDARNITPSKTTNGYDFVVTDCTSRTRANNGTVTQSTKNNALIPYRIFGIAHND